MSPEKILNLNEVIDNFDKRISELEKTQKSYIKAWDLRTKVQQDMEEEIAELKERMIEYFGKIGAKHLNIEEVLRELKFKVELIASYTLTTEQFDYVLNERYWKNKEKLEGKKKRFGIQKKKDQKSLVSPYYACGEPKSHKKDSGGEKTVEVESGDSEDEVGSGDTDSKPPEPKICKDCRKQKTTECPPWGHKNDNDWCTQHEPRENGVCYYSRIIKTESGVQDTFFDGKVYTIVKREDLNELRHDLIEYEDIIDIKDKWLKWIKKNQGGVRD